MGKVAMQHLELMILRFGATQSCDFADVRGGKQWQRLHSMIRDSRTSESSADKGVVSADGKGPPSENEGDAHSSPHRRTVKSVGIEKNGKRRLRISTCVDVACVLRHAEHVKICTDASN